MNWRSLFSRWRRDYDFKTFMNSTVSLLLTAGFAFYNGFLGIAHGSPWHGSIGVYYLLLVILRGVMLMTEKRVRGTVESQAEKLRWRSFIFCSILLLLLNISLVGPVSLLVKQEKPVGMTLVPAMAMAAYAFYKIILAGINLAKRKKSANCLVRLLRTINFMDALVSIMTLQNTLIMVSTKGDKLTMLPLTATASGLMWLAIVALSISSLIAGLKENRRMR